MLRLSEGLNFCWFLKLNFSICQPAINQNFHRPNANYTEITIIKCALVFRFNHPFCFLVRPNDFVEAKLRYTHFIVLITCYCGWLGDSVSLNLRSPELFSWAASLHPFVPGAQNWQTHSGLHLLFFLDGRRKEGFNCLGSYCVRTVKIRVADSAINAGCVQHKIA